MSRIRTRVLVAIAHHETLHDTSETIASLLQTKGVEYKVIVLDNGSSDRREANLLRERFPDIIVIRSERNLGSASGINRAIRYGLSFYEPDYVLVLDSDVFVDHMFLSTLVGTSIRVGSGITGAQILSYENNQRSMGIGGRIIWQLGLVVEYNVSKNYRLGNQAPVELEWVQGTAMLIRRDVIERIGLFNPLITGWEDFEYCLRARRNGFTVFGEPRALVWHKVASTRRRRMQRTGITEPVTPSDIIRYARFLSLVSPHPTISYVTAILIGYPLGALRLLFVKDNGLRTYYHRKFLRTLRLVS